MRVIAALGGKREKGALKEKKDCSAFRGLPVEEEASWPGCDDRRERKVKSTVVRKNATTMITLGGRMMWMRYGGAYGRPGQLAAVTSGN